MRRQWIVAIVFGVVFILNGCGLARKPKLIPPPLPSKEFVGLPISQVVTPEDLFMVGEELEYQVRWLGVDVGKATMGVKQRVLYEGKPAYHILMTVVTSGFFSLFFHVDGFVESYVDAATGNPMYHNSETNINQKFVFKRIWFDFDANQVKAEDRKGTYELALAPGTLDPLGIFYFFRKRPIVVDQPISLVINGGKRNFPVTVYARKVRKVHVPEGGYQAFLVEPTNQSERQFDDIINATGSMRIWFSADKRRIPLMITLQVPLGTAIAALSRVSFPEPPVDDSSVGMIECPIAAASSETGAGGLKK